MRVAWLLFLMGLMTVSGCSDGKRFDVSLRGIEPEAVIIHRYDLDLFSADRTNLRESLEQMKPAYRFFLDTDLGDSSKLTGMIGYLNNPRNLEYHAAVERKYKNVIELEKTLTQAFKYYSYHYPGFRVPRVYAYISGGDYDYPVQFADSVMLIGLDNYLGAGFQPYIADGLPLYRIARMTPDYVVPDCMKVLGKITYPEQLPGHTLLEQMIAAGKRLLFLDAMMPHTSDRIKIGYTEKQYEWMLNHEAHVWTAIIENRMLYTTDGKLIRSFMADGPFTAEFSQESPARLGEWLGWQIVRNYFENQPGVTLHHAMTEPDAQKILNLSGYKPAK